MEYKHLKYIFLGLASVFFAACTEEDDNVKVPEYNSSLKNSHA